MKNKKIKEIISKLNVGKLEKAKFISEKRYGFVKRKIFMDGFLYARNNLQKSKKALLIKENK